VVRPAATETTALGAAYLAGLGVGFWKSIQETAAKARRFEPKMPESQAAALRQRWNQAVARSKAWENSNVAS
jgi:glycerol kinase